jgi:MFS family permease
LWLLVAFRCLQAAGAAILTPSSLGLVLTSMPPARVARSVRIWAAAASLAGAAGPVAGGLLIGVSWRWIFVINVPIGAAAFIAAVKFVPSAKRIVTSRLPDMLGGGLLIVAIGALALGLVKAPDWGWAADRTVLCWVVSAVALAAFVVSSARHPFPVVELPLLKHRVFAWSNITAILMSGVFATELLSVILFLQDSWHWSALQTGLAIAPGPCLVSVFAVVGQRMSRRLPVGVIAGLGLLLIALGPVLMLATVGTAPNYAGDILPGWLLVGVGSGLALPTVIASATVELPRHQTATGSAVVNMSRQIGTVLGTSILVVLVGTATGASAHNAFVHLWWFCAAVGLAGAVTALGISPRRRPTPISTEAAPASA